MITRRDILKSMFPRIFLKRAFLAFNSIKRNTWDHIFYQAESISYDQFLIHKEFNPFLSNLVDTSRYDTFIKSKLAIWENPKWTQDQYILIYKKPGYIEPKVGWGVSFNRKLIYPSLGFASAPHVHRPRFTEFYFKRNITKLNSIISLRDTGEENYFHFYNDVLAKLFFLKEKGVSIQDYTIVISIKLYQKQYFQYFLNNTFLGDLSWHIQGAHEWVNFKEAIFCKPFTHTKSFLNKAVDLVKQKSKLNTEKRLFLTRSTSSLRYVENLSEIEILLRKHKFQLVDTSQISLDLQIELFGNCRHLIAIHGAGITNIIFRMGQPLSILELVHPSPYIPFHYILMAKLYGYDYDVMMGEKGQESRKGGFKIDVTHFEMKILHLLKDSL